MVNNYKQSKFCNCGCGQLIEYKQYYKYRGWPDFIHGHNNESKTEKHKKNLSQSMKGKYKGRSLPEKTKEKISESMKGVHKGTATRGSGWSHSEETKQILSEKFKNREFSDEAIQKMKDNSGNNTYWEGKKRSKKTKEKISESVEKLWDDNDYRDQMTGSNSHVWKGGRTEFSQLIRESRKYKEWRKQVYERDNYTCQKCGVKNGGNLNADHIVPLSKLLTQMLELVTPITKEKAYEIAMRWEPLWKTENGRTLCFDCHKETDTYSGKTQVANVEMLL